jgi:hypothetical protein
MIYQNYQGCGEYREYLRQGRGKRKSRVGSKSKRGHIPSRVAISKRPAVADQKTEIGHWESDTMIGGNHLGVLVIPNPVDIFTSYSPVLIRLYSLLIKRTEQLKSEYFIRNAISEKKYVILKHNLISLKYLCTKLYGT